MDVPNASHVLDASFVTYANQAKVKFVNVAEESIAEHGVVSECVALSMAKGAAAAANAEIGSRAFPAAGLPAAHPKNPSEPSASAFISAGKRNAAFRSSKFQKPCISVRREGRLSAMQA